MSTSLLKKSDLIGQRIRLEDYRLPPELSAFFPREGRIVRQLEALNRVKDWYLLELDQPFEHGGLQQARVLIRTRRTDIRLGEEEPTSAYVLLIRDPAALEERPFDVKKFNHVGSAMAISLFPDAPRVVERREEEEDYRRCKHCGKKVNLEVAHCPSCGERIRWSVKPELAMVARLGIGLVVLLALAAAIVKTDPTVSASVKNSSWWYKAPVGIFAAIGLWFVIDLLLDRFSKHR